MEINGIASLSMAHDRKQILWTGKSFGEFLIGFFAQKQFNPSLTPALSQREREKLSDVRTYCRCGELSNDSLPTGEAPVGTREGACAPHF
jgi:hypothetical protein